MLMFLLILFSVLTTGMLVAVSYKMLQLFQLSSYRVGRVWDSLKQTRFEVIARYFALAFLSFIGMLVYLACFGRSYGDLGILPYFGIVFFFGLGAVFMVFTIKEKQKTPLVITGRIIRQFVILSILLLPLTALLIFVTVYPGFIISVTVSYSLLAWLYILVPFLCFLSHFIAMPFERVSGTKYEKKAVRIIEVNSNMIRIAITGSYGKTTAKNILTAILEKKYKVCSTPESYNTPAGISKTANYVLPDDAEIFIAEMGAKQKGDIEKLAKMVRPNYGIITNIGTQHLKSFGSEQNIADTKFELMENLESDGVAVFNGDDNNSVKLYNKCTVANKLITGSREIENITTGYSFPSTSISGTKFNVKIHGRLIGVETKLLGKYVPSVICQCIAVAEHLGVSADDIVSAISELKPVKHRLQIIGEHEETTIIDDSYNSNPVGAESALTLLRDCILSTRIIITPGFVEMGHLQKEANYKLGILIAKCTDMAILNSDNAQDIKDGCLAGGMNEDKIFITENLDESLDKALLVEGKKTILFENDLPDNMR